MCLVPLRPWVWSPEPQMQPGREERQRENREKKAQIGEKSEASEERGKGRREEKGKTMRGKRGAGRKAEGRSLVSEQNENTLYLSNYNVHISKINVTFSKAV